jgi:hypothetical protein
LTLSFRIHRTGHLSCNVTGNLWFSFGSVPRRASRSCEQIPGAFPRRSTRELQGAIASPFVAHLSGRERCAFRLGNVWRELSRCFGDDELPVSGEAGRVSNDGQPTEAASASRSTIVFRRGPSANQVR